MTEVPKELKRFTGDLSSISPEYARDILGIIGKFISLGFGAEFKKLEIGPIVKMYYFEPSLGSMLSKILGKEEDIALSLGVESVLIQRELQYITVAVPRKDRQLIEFKNSLYKLMTSAQEMELPILLGQNPKGEEIYADVASQPHILIGGATGSGKSVFTSQLLSSLALFRTPKELEITLVDTKQLDLVLFDGLPHISEVIKDIHDLRTLLMHLIAEVRKRTGKMSGMARNIIEWNSMFPQEQYKFKIVIIDEFADIVDTDAAYLKSLPPSLRPDSIQVLTKTLAQIARAAGIHLIVATQRPSVKVIPGDLKTNFPCRIAFKLPSMQDSRVILDENGAEKLLGKGDFLYKITGSDTLKRAHSAFVSMNDIATILAQSEFLRTQFIRKGE